MSLAVSLFGSDSRVIASRLQRLQAKDQYAELRLDRLASDIDWQLLDDSRGDLELILACVPSTEGGTYDGGFDGWWQHIETALQNLSPPLRVDVPPCFAEQASAVLPADLPRIWSWHQQPPDSPESPQSAKTRESTEPLESLEAVFRQLASQADSQRGDVVKLVAWADNHEQSLAVLPLYQLPGPKRVIFTQGPGSAASRLWALAMGAPWSYACWRDQAVAPGQWAEHLVRRREDWTQTKLFGVIGDPVEHSRSPLLWSCAFDWLAAAGTHSWSNGLYLPLRHTEISRKRLQQSYGSSHFQAFSVTAPLKQQALAAADEASDVAQAIGAANFLVRKNGKWLADNTDGCGAMDPLEAAGLLPGSPIVILGAGGAARAAAFEAGRRGFQVTVAARRLEQAQSLAADLTRAGISHAVGIDLASPSLWNTCRTAAGETEPTSSSPNFAVIQATPLGSAHRPGNPVADHAPPAGGIAMDMVYHPARTQFLEAAELAGCRTLPGHHMLLAQMLRQFELGSGKRPPEKALRIALESDLGMNCPPILLVGPRASGKSTLGRMLAQSLGLDFLDADDELESKHKRLIRDWIPIDEPGFREAEAELLTELVSRQGAVVALGGGVIERPDSLALLRAQPRVIALEISQQEQLRRRQQDERPALTNSALPEEIRVLHKRRAELYLAACSGRRINVEGNLSTAFLRLLQSINLIG